MSVSHFACKICGEIYCDCGDDLWFCQNGHGRICKHCLSNGFNYNDDGEVSPEFCPICNKEATP